MKFHWGDCCHCPESTENDQIRDIDRLGSVNKTLWERIGIQNEELEKKNKQICNLELYVNELSAKLKMKESNENS